jgi:predicted permease
MSLFQWHFPTFVVDVLDVFAKMHMGIVLLMLGIYMNFKFEKTQWGTIGRIILIRYIIGLSVGLILFFTLPFDITYRGILLIGLILPVAGSAIPFVVLFGYDRKMIGTLANLTILMSFGLMWLLILSLHLV